MGVVTSTANRGVKSARKLHRRAGRAAAGAFLVEGPHAVAEAVGSLTDLLVTEQASSEHAAVVDEAVAHGAEIVTVTERVLASVATTVSPQGMVGVASREDVGMEGALAVAGLVAVCWRVSDPGNLGTILRTADAAGVDAVVTTSASVDPYNPKAVRASAGSLFHLPVASEVDPDALVAACRDRAVALVAVDAAGTTPHTDLDLTRPTALLFGTEAHGLPSGLRAAADVVARVPILGRAESLNLAATAAVMFYEAARQRGFTRAAGLHQEVRG